MNHNVGVELTEKSPGYHIFTQKDMVNFLYTHSKKLDIMTKKSVSDLGAVHPSIFATPTHMIVMDLVKCLRNQSLQAVPIVEGVKEDKEQEKQFIIVSAYTYLVVKSKHFVCLFEARLNNIGAYVNFNSLYWILTCWIANNIHVAY